MARVVSFGGDYNSLPLAMRRAHEADRTYVDQARCLPSGDSTQPRVIWTAEPERTYNVAGQKLKGSTLNEWAALECEMCPVQWECAIAAIVAEEPIGVWGDTAENLRVFRARVTDPVAVMVSMKGHLTVREVVAKAIAVA